MRLSVNKEIDREMWRERRPAITLLLLAIAICGVAIFVPKPKQNGLYVTGKIVSASASQGKSGGMYLAVELDDSGNVVRASSPWRTGPVRVGQRIRMACWDTAFGRRYEFREYIDESLKSPS